MSTAVYSIKHLEVIIIEMNEILNAISNVGFPIVACCFMAYYAVHLNKTIANLQSSIEANTATIATLISQKGGGDSESE